jgi:hypothetical protein
MPLAALQARIAGRLRELCDPIPDTVDAAAALAAQAVYAICKDDDGPSDLTQEDVALWTSFLGEALGDISDALYEAHFAEDRK